MWPQVPCGGSITQESAMGGAPGSPRMGCRIESNQSKCPVQGVRGGCRMSGPRMRGRPRQPRALYNNTVLYIRS
jgi:hypothetical protein